MRNTLCIEHSKEYKTDMGDSSGRETIVRVTGGMKVKADRDESSPYAAMLAAQDVAVTCKNVGITALHVKIRATGGQYLAPDLYRHDVHKILTLFLRQWHQDSRPWRAGCASRTCPCWHENRSHRGRYPDAVRFYSQKGWSPWSPFVNAPFLFPDGKKQMSVAAVAPCRVCCWDAKRYLGRLWFHERRGERLYAWSPLPPLDCADMC